MPDPRATGRRPLRHGAALAAAALGAASLTHALAQDRPSAPPPPVPLRPAPLPDLPQGSTSFDDAAESFGGLQFSDLAKLVVAPVGQELVFQAEMKEELADGMYTKLEADFDFDGRRDEAELRVRGAVGSRFRPSSFVPPKGLDPPLTILRASWASPFDERRGGTARIGMTNWDTLRDPEVGGRRLRLRVPRDLILSRAKGSTSPPAFRVRATTTCSEHPVAFDYDALDAGRAIVVDGRADEWSGGPYAEDPAGELHDAVSHLDLRAVWCEHGADAVCVRIDLDRAGFGSIRRGDGDVSVDDKIVVRLEPRGDAYMADVEVEIPATTPRGRSDGGATWASGARCVEVSIPRNPKQTRFRVVVWADAIRTDVLRGEWLPIPGEWWK